jgi:DivIVA domain-containing protein
VELDRQSIERKDFPIGRRGYDPAAVDAHLRALAVEVEELRRSAASGATDMSLAASAGTKVHVIVEAAEAAAAEIERQASEAAHQAREAADRDAERTREEAIEQARAHVAAVSQAAATLLERVGGMDAEVRALVDSLNTGAGRLAADLGAVETNMAELYDAAAGTAAAQQPGPEPAAAPAEEKPTAPGAFEAELAGAMAAAPTASEPQQAPAPAEQPEGAPAEGGAVDLDGARLIALNMALNGESRADTERYLAENFELADRDKLVDEVYAAIEG